MNKQLPLIIGFGGVNCAGRSSGHHAFRRLVFSLLDSKAQNTTLESLAALMATNDSDTILNNTLVRSLSDSWYQRYQNDAKQAVELERSRICLSNRKLPDPLPENWQMVSKDFRNSIFDIETGTKALLSTQLKMDTNAAGCLPEGFDLSGLYSSRNHPRSLQMALFALSDCLGNSGLDWQELQSLLPPDQISVYAGSSFGQLDYYGIGGLLKSNSLAKRPTAKQIPLGYSQSPADFANAYVLGNFGSTGASLGACASFLYNLRHAYEDLASGRCQLAVVGASEAPLVPELINGFDTMGALCNDANLRKLDALDANAKLDYSRACRPFGVNSGFVMSESAQFFLLATPEFAAQIGAQVFGAIGDVLVNADGYKKSISSTGVGNAITLAKAAASLRSLLGDRALKRDSIVFAHGTGTPLNRVTESAILNQIAKAFAIPSWRVSAIKGLVGHSQGVAAADQLMAALGMWQDNILPGISTTQVVADDVQQSNLNILLQPELGKTNAALINAKGFGGNNATALVLSGEVANKAMGKLLTGANRQHWLAAQETSIEKAHQYDLRASRGEFDIRYLYDHQVALEKDVEIDRNSITIPGQREISLQIDNPYGNIFD